MMQHPFDDENKVTGFYVSEWGIKIESDTCEKRLQKFSENIKNNNFDGKKIT